MKKTPLKQFQDLIRYGVNTHQGNLSLGGAAEQGFLEGQQRAIDRQERTFMESERQRLADEREQKEFDAVYGELYVPPTGQKSYDAEVETMGREWKAEYAALNAAKKAGQVSNEEFVAKKHEILNRAKELKAGQEALNQTFLEFQKAKEEGKISASTPARNKLFYQAMEEGLVQIENIEGRPTLVGQLEDGEPVQIDMAALASGQAGLKFNQKVDTEGAINQIAGVLEKYKTTVENANGLAYGNLGWEAIQEKASHDVDQLINNRSTLEAIAADDVGEITDELGNPLLLNNETIKELSDDELRDIVKPYLLDKIQREYFPVQKQTNYTAITPYQQAQLNRAPVGRGGGAPTAAQLKAQQQQEIAQSIAQINPAGGGLSQLNGLGGYTVEYNSPGIFSDESYTIIDAKGNKQKLPPAEAQNFLQNTLVGTPAQGGGPVASEADPLGLGLGGDAPIKRNGPDKKKKDKPKKDVSHSLYVPGYTKHFQGVNTDFSRVTGQPTYHQGIGGSEGGQGGLIYSQKRQAPDRRGGTVYTVGALQNSYGDPIGAATVGREWTLGKKGRTKLGVHGGLTYGYGKSFDDRYNQIKDFNEANPRGAIDPATGERVGFKNLQKDFETGFYGGVRRSNLAPVVNAQLSHDFGGDPSSGLGVSALLNPLYANVGLNYRFPNKKKKKKKK